MQFWNEREAGVPLQLAQKAMRHSTPTLTANTYTHLALLDVSGAVNRLPGLVADKPEAMKAVAENSLEKRTPLRTPLRTPPVVKNVHSLASNSTMGKLDTITEGERKSTENPLFSGVFQGDDLVGRAGFEPATLGLRVPCSTS